MTTIRQIITDAYREGGIIQIGLTPEAEELDEGLRKLQTLVRSLLGNELGVPLASVSYGKYGLSNVFGEMEDVSGWVDNYYVPPNTRLVVNLNSAATVYLDPNPQDGARFAVIDNAGQFGTANFTVNANGRKIEGASSVVLSTNGDNKEWFYREDLGEWKPVETLTVSSENPFPSEFDDFLVTLLAMRLSPRFQAQVAPETMLELNRMRRQFRARYKQITQMGSEAGLVRLPSLDGYYSDGVVFSGYKFNRGLST